MRRINVSADRSAARVGERETEAETPRELRRILSEAIYDVFHSGQQDAKIPTRLRDPALEARFAAVVPHADITTSAVARSGAEQDDKGNTRVLVEREGVRFWAPEGVLAAVDGQPADAEVKASDVRPGDVVRLRMSSARPGLSPGFFLVDGSTPRRGGRDVLRLYVNVTNVDDAIGVWGAALSFLEERGLPYRAKVLSAPELYPRRDALVVYLDGELASVAPELAAALGDLPGIGADTSSFVEELRPGIATAWEPTDPHSGRQGLSFGQHRASVLATALVDSSDTPDTAERTVVERFTEAGIDPANPARNLPSAA
ncbi:T3SS effector HopA1 family protein [Streptomyces sp. WM6373]|uniref:T3SS effector HopA1 family protein n=1 Tax=Streptomyces sp. WM6373 TaxID=1415556 RepID=UPI0006ADB1F3|nr:T3SS effector HopA1 family protein [Streptomyces sp. WM6373]